MAGQVECKQVVKSVQLPRGADDMMEPCYNCWLGESKADMTRIPITLASALALTGCMTQMPKSDYRHPRRQASICKREEMMGLLGA